MSAISPRRFRAPGKLMLAGEHSVLAPGGEALAVAIDLGVEVEARPQEAWELRRLESGASWCPGAEVPEELRFAQAAWAEACTALGEPPPHALVTRGYGAAASGAAKPGVGGSASAAVAIAAAVSALAGRALDAEGLSEVLRLALRAHRRAQTGRGSGYDVATVTLGGLLRWRPAPPPGAPGAAHLVWPEGLHLLAGYSGRSAPTAPLLARLEATLAPQTLEADLRRLGAPVQTLARSLEEADLLAILAAARACQAALEEWDGRRQLGLVTPALARLIVLAEERGGAAKVSGAGAGDSAIALCASREIVEEIAASWAAEGFLVFRPPITALGVREI